MKNANEILERILLNMKYDSKKTLSENKSIILNEESLVCENIRLKHRKQYSKYKKGNLRNPEKPNWGKWGDGKGLCCDNPKHENGIYHKDCKKSPKVKDGDVSLKLGRLNYHENSPNIALALAKSKNWDESFPKDRLVKTKDYNGNTMEFFGIVRKTVGEYFGRLLEELNKEGSYFFRANKVDKWVPFSGDYYKMKNANSKDPNKHAGIFTNSNGDHFRIKNKDDGWGKKKRAYWMYKEGKDCYNWYWEDEVIKDNDSEEKCSSNSNSQGCCLVFEQAKKCRAAIQDSLIIWAKKEWGEDRWKNVLYYDWYLDPYDKNGDDTVLKCVKNGIKNVINKLGKDTPYDFSVYLPKYDTDIEGKTSGSFYESINNATFDFKPFFRPPDFKSGRGLLRDGVEILGYVSRDAPKWTDIKNIKQARFVNKELNPVYKKQIEGKKERRTTILLDYLTYGDRGKPENSYTIDDVCKWLSNPNSAWYYKGKKFKDVISDGAEGVYQELVNKGIIKNTEHNRNEIINLVNDLSLIDGDGKLNSKSQDFIINGEYGDVPNGDVSAEKETDTDSDVRAEKETDTDGKGGRDEGDGTIWRDEDERGDRNEVGVKKRQKSDGDSRLDTKGDEPADPDKIAVPKNMDGKKTDDTGITKYILSLSGG